MIEKLRRYRERFLKLAQERLEAAFGHANRDDGAESLYRELHALAGEAAMLQLADIASAGSQSEADARTWMQDGSITARAKATRGLRLLARAVSELERSIAETAAPAPPPKPPTTQGRVLIIDDSVITREQLRDALVDSDIHAVAAADLASALEVMRDLKPQLVLADVNLPGVTCDALCARLRESSTSPMQIMLVSGLAEAELQVRSHEVNAELWVSKRAGIAAVVDRVATALRASPLVERE